MEVKINGKKQNPTPEAVIPTATSMMDLAPIIGNVFGPYEAEFKEFLVAKSREAEDNGYASRARGRETYLRMVPEIIAYAIIVFILLALIVNPQWFSLAFLGELVKTPFQSLLY